MLEDRSTLHLDRTHRLVVHSAHDAVDAAIVEGEEDVGGAVGMTDDRRPDEPLHDLSHGAV
jgi:hypothetical protein